MSSWDGGAFARDLDRIRDLDRTRVCALQRFITLDFALERARALASDPTTERDLARALHLERDLARALERDLARPRNLGRALDIAVALARALAIAEFLARDLAIAVDGDLAIAIARDRALVLDLAGDLNVVRVRLLSTFGSARGSAAIALGRRPGHRRNSVARRLLAAAVWLLPAGDQARYRYEFRSELEEIALAGGGRFTQLVYMARVLRSSVRLRAELKSPRRQSALP